MNVYVPVYDTLLIAVAVTLTIGALKEDEGVSSGWAVLLTIAISAISLKSETIAHDHGIQPLTILILFLGLGQAIILQRLVNKTVPSGEAAASPVTQCY